MKGVITMFTLKCIYDSRKSFYNKALIVRVGGALVLYSYQTKVAKISASGSKLTLFDDWDCSSTTLRHVKEFIRQFLNGSNHKLSKRDVAKLANK